SMIFPNWITKSDRSRRIFALDDLTMSLAECFFQVLGFLTLAFTDASRSRISCAVTSVNDQPSSDLIRPDDRRIERAFLGVMPASSASFAIVIMGPLCLC